MYIVALLARANIWPFECRRHVALSLSLSFSTLDYFPFLPFSFSPSCHPLARRAASRPFFPILVLHFCLIPLAVS